MDMASQIATVQSTVSLAWQGDFLLMLIELLLLCRPITAEALRTNIVWKSAISLQRGQVGGQKFHIEGVVPTNRSSSHKTRLNDLSYGIKNSDRSFFHFVTNHAFERRADRRTEFSSPVRVCIPCSVVTTCLRERFRARFAWFQSHVNHEFRPSSCTIACRGSYRTTTVRVTAHQDERSCMCDVLFARTLSQRYGPPLKFTSISAFSAAYINTFYWRTIQSAQWNSFVRNASHVQ